MIYYLLLAYSVCDRLSDKVNGDNCDSHAEDKQPLGYYQTVATEDGAANIRHDYLYNGDNAEYDKESPVLCDVVENVYLLCSCIECVEYSDEDEECKAVV